MPKRNVGSFDYKVINKDIKKILRARSELNNTVQVAMPFVKATTTIYLPEFLGDGNIGFTLGLHSIDEDVLWENMYSETDIGTGYPLVGYTNQYEFQTGKGKPKRIYAKPPSTNVSATLRLFDQGAETVNTTKMGRIPPPGITQVKIGRNKNGLLAAGEINFIVPSLPQLEILHRTFLIPGCGMILEWGQQFAAETNPSFGEFSTPTNIAEHMFPWHDRVKTEVLLYRIAKRDIGLQEILDNYVYPTQGQYMWMFGRIANFSTKANSDGSFNCNVKIVGPSEDAWAYSTRSTVLPAVDASKNFCTADAESVENYFGTTSSGWNLKSILDQVLGGTILPDWKSHVQRLPKGNKSDGEKEDKTKKSKSPNVSEMNFAESEDAYFFTWRFFVNIVINDSTYGLKYLFSPPKLTREKAETVGLLRPYADGARTNVLTKIPGEKYIDDPTEPYVGYNKYLRSIDPSVMIIVHERAARESARFLDQNRPGDIDTLTGTTDKTEEFLAVGDFQYSISKAGLNDDPKANTFDPDRGFLSAGVWLNHKTVCTSMLSGDTILRGISNLLERMNAATRGYWQLTLDQSEPLPNANGQVGTNNQHSYVVVDANWRGTSDQAVKIAIEGGDDGEPGLYVFNKYIRRTPSGELVGSELTECNIDLSLPKRMFSQIATLGLVQKEDLAKAGVSDEPETGEKSALIADPNDTLREMFAITTLSIKSKERGPDLTILPFGKTPPNQCGQANTATTAMTAGTGQKVAGQNIDSIPKDADKDELEEAQKKANEILSSELCTQKCAKFLTTESPAQVQQTPQVVSPPATVANPANKTLCDTLTGTEKQLCQFVLTQGITDPVELANFMAQIGHESRFRYEGENLAYKAAFLYKNFPKTANRPWGFASEADSSTICCGKDRKALANRIYGTRMGNSGGDDGWNYRGRGFIQITGKANYRAASGEVGVDLVANPDYLLTFEGSAKSAIWFWKQNVRPAVSKKNATYCSIEVTTKAINGGYIGLEDRKSKFNSYLTKFGLNSQCQPIITPTPTTTPPVNATPAVTPPAVTSPVPIPSECAQCINAQQVVKQATAQLDVINSTEKLVREFPHLEQIFRYIEPFPDVMVAAIRGDADGNKANAFGASPGTLSITAELEMPGINGIRVGELFWIDRIPAFYRAFGAFQVMSVEDTVGLEGWKTRIESRFNYLGNAWKQSVDNILQAKNAATIQSSVPTNPILPLGMGSDFIVR